MSESLAIVPSPEMDFRERNKEEFGFPYKFSIVMAVYNVEPFLREAVDSVLAQDIGFEENVQLILVDDGSQDCSGAICDEYKEQFPNNILVIHKENGGVSSARNEGLKHVEGRYINFFDPDDKLSANTLSRVYYFFSQHDEEVDLVSIPIYLFGAQSGPHILNHKFKKGTRIIDLRQEPTLVQLSSASAFFTYASARKLNFDTKLIVAEDAKEILNILLDKFSYGVVHNARYEYRKRESNFSSLQSAPMKKGWYIQPLEQFSLWAIETSLKKRGYVPSFVQYTVLYDLQWKIKSKIDIHQVLSSEEIDEFKTLFAKTMSYMDNSMIQALSCWPEYKAFFLQMKYGRPPERLLKKNNLLLYYENTNFISLSQCSVTIEFLEIEEGCLHLEGQYVLLGCTEQDDVQFCVRTNEQEYPCTKVEDPKCSFFVWDEPLMQKPRFKVDILLDTKTELYNCQLFLLLNGHPVRLNAWKFGRFSPISKAYVNSYYFKDGWMLSLRGWTLRVQRCGRKGLAQREKAFIKELRDSKKESDQKAAKARIVYRILNRILKKPIWLVSDRINKADDNGEAFFQYLNEHHTKEIDSYFVLSKDSPDFERISKIGKVVDHLSFKHKLLYLLCEANISSQADYITDNPFQGFLNPYRDIMVKHRFVFLQHGVTKDDISGWVNRYNKNISCFVTAAQLEWESIVNGIYFYPSKNIALTGFPRFDWLYHDERKRITLMPTWRKYLADGLNAGTGIWILGEKFIKSSYYQFYYGLLSHPRLLEAAREQGYKICFMPHPTIQPHLELFHLLDEIEVYGIDTSYRDIYAQSNLILTDYSSAVFDFAYLRKPVLYTQFDKEEFFKGEHVYTQGYFDYERYGFGEVEYDLESTVDRIIEYMKNGCQLKEKYRKRIDNFFAFNDKNNCQRVYEAIRNLI